MIDHQGAVFSSEVLIYEPMLNSKTDTLELEWNLDLQISNTLQYVWEASSSVRYLFYDCHL